MKWISLVIWLVLIVAFVVGWIRTARLRRPDRPLFPPKDQP